MFYYFLVVIGFVWVGFVLFIVDGIVIDSVVMMLLMEVFIGNG